MSALSSALDRIEQLQIGENMNQEYSWSQNIEELITQFHFQLTRTSDTKNLEDKYQELLKKIFIPVFTQDTEYPISTEYIKIIYKLIGYTRDIVAGKGEYNLTYMLISGLYKFSKSSDCPIEYRFKLLAMCTSALESLVKTNIGEHPYGSWKDLKYFCNYHISKNDRFEYRLKELNDPLINKVIQLICGQLRCDEKAPVKSLLAKWIPREKSQKFGWITGMVAMEYYKCWVDSSLPCSSAAARRKCLTHFRQLVSKVNKELHTPQINQCNGTWSEIDFDKNVTSITLRKQSKAFHAADKNGNPKEQLVNNADRMKCKENYRAYIERCKTGQSIAKGKRVSIVDFVRDAISVIDPLEKDCINAQWINNGEQNNGLEECLAMIDTSGSMEADNNLPLYSALGLGLRIAEKSKLGKRVMTFSSTPSWINLDDCPDFVSMVHKVRRAPWGMNTNFRAALDLILDTAITQGIAPIEMKKLVLVILSDMQIDCADCSRTITDRTPLERYAGLKDIDPSLRAAATRNIYENPLEVVNTSNLTSPMFQMMKQKYHDAGMRSIYHEPYELPHIIFWNLRSTTGFPSLSTTENTSMMSGNNPVLLNAFCNKGLTSLKEYTPWKLLTEELSNKRYDYLDNIIRTLWN